MFSTVWICLMPAENMVRELERSGSRCICDQANGHLLSHVLGIDAAYVREMEKSRL